jgi:hypothetical protein
MSRLLDTVIGAYKALMGDGKPELKTASGFKALGNAWFAWWSNNFEDHDGEYFSEKAIDEYVRRVDVGAVPFPELWLWHTPGTKHGRAEWVGRVGHFAVAAGSFDETPAGQAAKAHYAKASGDYGMSHGFTYDPGQKRDGVYEQFNTFEISVLPAKAAANPYTAFSEVFEMEMDEEKRAFLARVLGSEEMAAQLITATEDKSRAMESLDVRYKDFVQMDAPAPVAMPAEAQDEKADPMMDGEDGAPVEDAAPEDAPPPSDMGEFVTAITEDVATLANAVNSLIGKLESVQSSGAAEKARHADEIASLRAEVKALREALDLRPRSATSDPATEIEKSALTESLKAQVEEDNYETVLGLRVKRAL